MAGEGDANKEKLFIVSSETLLFIECSMLITRKIHQKFFIFFKIDNNLPMIIKKFV